MPVLQIACRHGMPAICRFYGPRSPRKPVVVAIQAGVRLARSEVTHSPPFEGSWRHPTDPACRRRPRAERPSLRRRCRFPNEPSASLGKLQKRRRSPFDGTARSGAPRPGFDNGPASEHASPRRLRSTSRSFGLVGWSSVLPSRRWVHRPPFRLGVPAFYVGGRWVVFVESCVGEGPSLLQTLAVSGARYALGLSHGGRAGLSAIFRRSPAGAAARRALDVRGMLE